MEDLGKIIEEKAKEIEEETKKKQAEPIEEAPNKRDKKREREFVQNDDEKAELCYDIYLGVAEYAGIKKRLPERMQRVLYSVLAVLQAVLIVIFCIPFSAVNIIADGLEGVVEKFGTLSKPTKRILIGAIILDVLIIIISVIFRILTKAQ